MPRTLLFGKELHQNWLYAEGTWRDIKLHNGVVWIWPFVYLKGLTWRDVMWYDSIVRVSLTSFEGIMFWRENSLTILCCYFVTDVNLLPSEIYLTTVCIGYFFSNYLITWRGVVYISYFTRLKMIVQHKAHIWRQVISRFHKKKNLETMFVPVLDEISTSDILVWFRNHSKHFQTEEASKLIINY